MISRDRGVICITINGILRSLRRGIYIDKQGQGGHPGGTHLIQGTIPPQMMMMMMMMMMMIMM